MKNVGKFFCKVNKDSNGDKKKGKGRKCKFRCDKGFRMKAKKVTKKIFIYKFSTINFFSRVSREPLSPLRMVSSSVLLTDGNQSQRVLSASETNFFTFVSIDTTSIIKNPKFNLFAFSITINKKAI